MGFISKFLSNSVGNNLQNDPPDVRNTKTYLSQLGYFEDDTENDFITRELYTSIRDFQRDMNLRVDGRLFPGGETEENDLPLMLVPVSELVSGRGFVPPSRRAVA